MLFMLRSLWKQEKNLFEFTDTFAKITFHSFETLVFFFKLFSWLDFALIFQVFTFMLIIIVIPSFSTAVKYSFNPRFK